MMTSESSSFRSAVFDALCACLNLSPNSRDAVTLIHEAYAEPENVPRPPRIRNVIYWTVFQDPGMDPVSTAYDSEQPGSGRHTPVVYTTLKYQLIIVCYGPAAEAYAHRIRSMLYLDGAGFPRSILRKTGIRLVPDPPEPLLLHEPEGSLWRLRADLTISLRAEETQIHSIRRNAVTVAPVITIHKERG